MLYIMLAYHDEGHVQSWSEAEDAALMDRLNALHRRLGATGTLGPAARLGASPAAECCPPHYWASARLLRYCPVEPLTCH